MLAGAFDLLSPDVVIDAVEKSHGLVLDGTIVPYPSYINRVYGLRTEDEVELIAKFYRPDRWTPEAILQEHLFLHDCAEEEIPVVPPLPGRTGETLPTVTVSAEDGEEVFRFALFPKRAGRNFDAERDEDWFRLGGIAGRVHRVGHRRPAEHRTVCLPAVATAAYVGELLDQGIVHPDYRDEFENLAGRVLDRIGPLFTDVPLQRIHGDCHRGNILDRPGEGLLLIDFDDMMSGPPVQDLWLLLPGYAADCTRELTMILDGYEQFLPFDRRSLDLIEPLRFMRMIYFLSWYARRRTDYSFLEQNPGWGSSAFWVKEIEDLREQERVIHITAGL